MQHLSGEHQSTGKSTLLNGEIETFSSMYMFAVDGTVSARYTTQQEKEVTDTRNVISKRAHRQTQVKNGNLQGNRQQQPSESSMVGRTDIPEDRKNRTQKKQAITPALERILRDSTNKECRVAESSKRFCRTNE